MSQQRCQRPSFFLFAMFFLHYSASSSGSFPHGHRMAAAAPGIPPRHKVQKQEKRTFLSLILRAPKTLSQKSFCTLQQTSSHVALAKDGSHTYL